MAVMTTNEQKADVQAVGAAMNASVNFSGALMEMLATVYVYILMAAIREAVQNACDAARRNGLTFSEGVQVLLPTPENPMITVIDKGAGMTKTFMEDPAEGYLSFGSSTKRADDGTVGGLGVGRWAAYGYVRECYISTCHASDMVQRTYFQFQGPDSVPQVQLAAEVPGTVAGTKVFFPVKPSDIAEALRAVAWLKAVMQLTMGDSFSVDQPHLLPTGFPEPSGTVLDLGTENPALAGVKVYPMQGSDLMYGRHGLQKGSLVVLTNEAAGVGGLPFHVQAVSEDSVFAGGMVIAIPLSFRIPFMPSREEVKYTDEVQALMRAIDVAAAAAGVRRCAELFEERSLSSKWQLDALLGDKVGWHMLGRAAHQETPLSSAMKSAVGARYWDGQLSLPFVPQLKEEGLVCKHLGTFNMMKEVRSVAGELSVSSGPDSVVAIRFSRKKRCVLVFNDLPTQGVSRFRAWADTQPAQQYIYLSHRTDVSKAEAAARALSEVYGGELEVVRTSSLPAPARKVVGAKVVPAKVGSAGSLIYHCLKANKQVAATHGLVDSADTKKVWLGKNGGVLKGMQPELSLADCLGNGYYASGLKVILEAAKVRKLYLLTQKQEDALEELVLSLKDEGYWDLSAEDLLAEPDGTELHDTVRAAKSWCRLEDVVTDVLESSTVQRVRAGVEMQAVTENAYFTTVVQALAAKPRLELTGSRLDKAFAPYVDLLTGKIHLHQTGAVRKELYSLCQSLAKFGLDMQVTTGDASERIALSKALVAMKTAGTVDYQVIRNDMLKMFPLLGAIRPGSLSESEGDDLVKALALLYR